jgi:hypothetical protein
LIAVESVNRAFPILDYAVPSNPNVIANNQHTTGGAPDLDFADNFDIQIDFVDGYLNLLNSDLPKVAVVDIGNPNGIGVYASGNPI